MFFFLLTVCEIHSQKIKQEKFHSNIFKYKEKQQKFANRRQQSAPMCVCESGSAGKGGEREREWAGEESWSWASKRKRWHVKRQQQQQKSCCCCCCCRRSQCCVGVANDVAIVVVVANVVVVATRTRNALKHKNNSQFLLLLCCYALLRISQPTKNEKKSKVPCTSMYVCFICEHNELFLLNNKKLFVYIWVIFIHIDL